MQAIGGPSVRWSDSDHLLATIADKLGVQIFQFSKVNSKKGSPVPKPRPIIRPGQVDPHRAIGTASMSIAEAEAWKKRRNGSRRPGGN